MRQTVYLSKALQIWICVVFALLIIAVYPLRLFRRFMTVGETDAPRIVSEAVSDDQVIRQYFIAQYDKIDSVSVYVSSLDAGRYMALALQKDGYSSVCSRYIDLQNETVPGYVKVDLGVKLVPGEKYNLLLKGRYSTFHTAYEPSGQATVPGMLAYSNGWAPVANARLAFSLTYDLPFSKTVSLGVMAGIFLVGIVLCFVIRTVFCKKPKANRLLITGDVIRYPLSAFLAIALLALFIMNYPLCLFDQDPLEIAFYAVGILIALALSLYALNRFCTQETKEYNLRKTEWLMAALMALAIKYACDYVNGTYNLVHYITARQMMVCLLLMALLVFRPHILLHPISLIAALSAGILSYLWARGEWLTPEEDAVQGLNQQTKLTAVIVVLIIYTISCLIVEAVRNRKKLTNAQADTAFSKGGGRIPWYLLLTILTAAMLIAFRNTRLWIPVFVGLYVLVYLCARHKVHEGRWLLIVQNGVYIHFFVSMCYCLMHRAFQYFVFNRYGFVFHTVTVTAQYMTMVCAVAAAGLLGRVRRTVNGLSVKEVGFMIVMRASWKELMIFGISMSYMLFTISRLSMVTFFAMILFLLAVSAFGKPYEKDETRRASGTTTGLKYRFKLTGYSLAYMFLATVLLFPATFTLQRTLPALYADQHLHPAIEEVSGYPFYEDNLSTPPFLLGKSEPDSAAYIRVRRFYHIFIDRIFGAPFVFDWLCFDPYNYDKNQYQEYWTNGDKLPDWYQSLKDEARKEEEEISVSAESEEETPVITELEKETLASVEIEEEKSASSEIQKGTEEEKDISNGRFEIYKSYLANLNMTGHPEMTNENTVGPHAHNIYLQIAFDCGIPTGILFLVWIGLTILVALVGAVKSLRFETTKKQKIADSFLFILSLSVGFAVSGLFDWNFHLGNPCTLIFMMGIAPLVAGAGRIMKT